MLSIDMLDIFYHDHSSLIVWQSKNKLIQQCSNIKLIQGSTSYFRSIFIDIEIYNTNYDFFNYIVILQNTLKGFSDNSSFKYHIKLAMLQTYLKRLFVVWKWSLSTLNANFIQQRLKNHHGISTWIHSESNTLCKIVIVQLYG